MSIRFGGSLFDMSGDIIRLHYPSIKDSSLPFLRSREVIGTESVSELIYDLSRSHLDTKVVTA